MREFILALAMASVALPGAAIARNAEMRHDRREVREDRRELRQDRRELRRDRRTDQRVAYAAPYRGWNYRPVNVGFQLRPAFYGARYYINDYGTYGVRAPARWQRWVRYGDDLVLVNTRTGRVLQVQHYRNW